MISQFCGLISSTSKLRTAIECSGEQEGYQVFGKNKNWQLTTPYKVGSFVPRYTTKWGDKQIIINGSIRLTRELILSGDIQIFYDEGGVVKCSEIERKAILLGMLHEEQRNKYVLTRCDILQGRPLALVDLETRSVVFNEDEAIFAAVHENGVYTRSNRPITLVKYDFELNELWRYSREPKTRSGVSGSSESRRPKQVLGTGIVTVYFGHLGTERNASPDDMLVYRDGLLCAFDARSGVLLWEKTFNFSVEDYQLEEAYMYVVSGEDLHKICVRTGRTEITVNTGIHIPRHRKAVDCLTTLHIRGDEIYLVPLQESRITVYNKNDLVVLREYMLPKQWGVVEFLTEDTSTNELYFRTRLLPDTTPDYHREGVLVLNPETSPTDIPMEPEPDIDVEMRASGDNANEEELWVTISDCSLDDMIRFGELYTQNHCYRQGKTYGPSHCEPNPRFNGKVHFRVKNIDAPRERVVQSLEIFEKRFALWNGAESGGMYVYAGTDGKTLCSLDAAVNE